MLNIVLVLIGAKMDGHFQCSWTQLFSLLWLQLSLLLCVYFLTMVRSHIRSAPTAPRCVCIP